MMMILIETPDMLVWRSSVPVCPPCCVQWVSHLKSDRAVCSVSTAGKPLHSSRHFSCKKRGKGVGEHEQSRGTASHTPGRVPLIATFSTTKNVKNLPEIHSLCFSPKRMRVTRNDLSKEILNSGDILNITISMINSWIVGGWVIVVGRAWKKSWTNILSYLPCDRHTITFHQNSVREASLTSCYGSKLQLRDLSE